MGVARYADTNGGRQGSGCTIGRDRLYVTYGATCAINNDVVVATRPQRGEGWLSCARNSRQRPTYDYVSRTADVTLSNSTMGVARQVDHDSAGASKKTC